MDRLRWPAKLIVLPNHPPISQLDIFALNSGRAVRKSPKDAPIQATPNHGKGEAKSSV